MSTPPPSAQRPPTPGGSARRDRLARASLGSAAGTLLSRFTGFIRIVMVAYALGGGDPANAFTLANNTPNIIHDLVLGGVLAATFVPVFVERLANRPRAEAAESISAVVSLSLVLLAITTVLLIIGAPEIIDLYTFGAHTDPGTRALATDWLRFFGPQLFFYGVISLIAAILAARDRFATVGFVPVLNNLVGIFVLAVYSVIAHHANSANQVLHNSGLVAFLGIGTTLGVALQAAALVPALRRSGVRLQLVWRPSDPAVSRILSLSSWTFGFVVANQVAVFVVLALTEHLGATALPAYNYAFIFFQLPFAVVATAIVNVAAPDFTRAFSRGDLALFGARFGAATKKLLALILPATVGYLILARSAIPLVIGHGKETQADAHLAASVLVLFALGLPGYCLYFLAIRAFQAMQDTRTAFFLYLLENGINIAVAFLLYHSLGVKGLALSYSIAYSIAALVALVVLRDRIGTLGGSTLVSSSLRAGILSLLMAFAVALTLAITGSGVGLGGWVRLLVAIAVGIAAYAGGAGVAGSLHAWQTSRRPLVDAKEGVERGPNQDRH